MKLFIVIVCVEDHHNGPSTYRLVVWALKKDNKKERTTFFFLTIQGKIFAHNNKPTIEDLELTMTRIVYKDFLYYETSLVRI